MATYVGAGATCGPACGLAWAGGRRRYLERGARVDLSGLAGRADLAAAWGLAAPAGTGTVDAEGARAAGVRVVDAVSDPSPAEARSVSAAAGRLRRTYRKDGMVGLSALVRSCYAKARDIAAVAGCRAADRLAADIDAKASEGLGFPGLPYFEPASVASRLARALDGLKVPEGRRGDLSASWDAAAARAFAEASGAD